MPTLMSWGNSEGEKGRCDDKCHAAKTPKCKCMCGGTFHGAKIDGTYESKLATQRDRVIARAKELAAIRGFDLRTADELAQAKLF